MNQLNLINKNGILYADSREVAEMTSKRHADLIRDIDGYKSILDQNAILRSDEFFIESSYEAGTGKPYRMYFLTKKGCDMVANKMTGEKGVLFTATYVTKFEEMEQRLTQPQFQIPQTYTEALRLAADLSEENERMKLQVEADKPKVVFAESLQVSQDSILVGELANLLKQNGINIGGTRLFRYLREEGYLCKYGDRYNLPTQRSMELKLFEIKVGHRGSSDGTVKITRTPKVTTKGQMYFINKFKNHPEAV